MTEKREWWYIRCEGVLLITGLFAAAWLLTIRLLTRKKTVGTP